MLLRTEILHDFDTFSPSPHVSFKKRKKQKKQKRLAYPRISNFLHGSTAALGDLSLCSSRFRFPRAAPPRSVCDCQMTERAVSPTGPARARRSAWGGVRGMGLEGEDRFRSYAAGGAGRLLGDRSVCGGRVGLCINASEIAVVRPEGLLGRGRPSLWRV